jgi:hypothetical protein
MEIDNVPYLAKSGSHSHTDKGLLDGVYWRDQACAIFRGLGNTKELSWFTHVGPQLMALYVTRYMEKNALNALDFGNAGTMSGLETLQVAYTGIFVSRAVCISCQSLIDLMNKKAKVYGFGFSAEERSTSS